MAGGDESSNHRTDCNVSFAPTPLSRQNLLDEGIKEEAITVTGNTVIDALYMVVEPN